MSNIPYCDDRYFWKHRLMKESSSSMKSNEIERTKKHNQFDQDISTRFPDDRRMTDSSKDLARKRKNIDENFSEEMYMYVHG